MYFLALGIIVAAAIVAMGGRYEISSNRYVATSGQEGSVVYRVDRFTGEICNRSTHSIDWTCYRDPYSK